MFLEDNRRVDGQPVPEDIEKVLEGGTKVVCTDNGKRNVDGSDDDWPDESRDSSEVFRDDTDGHAHRVDVDDVVGDDGKDKQNHEEFSTSAHRGD